MKDKAEAVPMMKGQGTIKRGRLRRITIKNNYDENGEPGGHTVSAEHEPEAGDGKSPMGGWMPDAETSHSTPEEAMAKVNQHMNDNLKKFGGKKAKAPVSESVREAMGRKR